MQDTFTGYVPKVGDRVRIGAIDYKGEPGFYAGMAGRVTGVAPALSSCFVRLEQPTCSAHLPLPGYSGVRFFPGEVVLIDG